jgi:NTE family protein
MEVAAPRQYLIGSMAKSTHIGVALGAGGARGLTHIGVLRGLRKHGIPVNMVAGSSAGAVVGAMYAANQDIDWIEQRFRDMLESEPYAESGIHWIKKPKSESEPGFLEWAASYVRSKIVLNFYDSRQGVVKPRRLARVIEYLLPVHTFEELQLPFACCAVDLNTGQDRVLDSGDLVQAVVASSAIPGYLTPIERDNDLLVDGAIGQPIPGAVVRSLGADFVIAVDVSIANFSPLQEYNIINILGRSGEISAAKLSQAQHTQWDFQIRPDTLNLHWSQFDQLEPLVKNGEQAVDIAAPELLPRIQSMKGVKRWLGKILP